MLERLFHVFRRNLKLVGIGGLTVAAVTWTSTASLSLAGSAAPAGGPAGGSASATEAPDPSEAPEATEAPDPAETPDASESHSSAAATSPSEVRPTGTHGFCVSQVAQSTAAPSHGALVSAAAHSCGGTGRHKDHGSHGSHGRSDQPHGHGNGHGHGH